MLRIKKQTRIQLSKEGIDKVHVEDYLEVEILPKTSEPLKYVQAALGFLYGWIKSWFGG